MSDQNKQEIMQRVLADLQKAREDVRKEMSKITDTHPMDTDKIPDKINDAYKQGGKIC